jgi:hypothetical protein
LFLRTGTTELNVFNGINPNDVWRIYVVDDNGASASGNINAGWRLEITTAPANRSAKVLDFDGDGRTDFAVWRGLQTGGDSGYWYWQNSRNSTVGGLQFGIGAPSIPPDFPTPGDYDGDA